MLADVIRYTEVLSTAVIEPKVNSVAVLEAMVDLLPEDVPETISKVPLAHSLTSHNFDVSVKVVPEPLVAVPLSPNPL